MGDLDMQAAPDTRRFTAKYLMQIAGSPWTLFPFLTGSSILAAVWALSLESGLLTFAGIASLVFSVGILLTRFFLGSESIAKTVIAELQEETLAAREKELDRLDECLVQDGDPRTEAALRDLRNLARAFQEKKAWPETLNTRSEMDILSTVSKIYQRSVEMLQKSFRLWEIAEEMHTRESREPILRQREDMLKEVESCVGKLGNILAALQGLSLAGTGNEGELARLREELDTNLNVARAAEARIQSMEHEIRETKAD